MRKIFTAIFISVFFIYPPVISAEKIIRVSGFVGPRTRYALQQPSGQPPTSFDSTRLLYNQLIYSNNFGGQEAPVKCSIDLQQFYENIETGLLVDDDGNLQYDIFFGDALNNNLTETEVIEIEKFLNRGGIFFGSGYSGIAPRGPQYNPLLTKLGFLDYFESTQEFVGGEAVSDIYYNVGPIPKTILGPFGVVNHLRHANFRNFVSYDLPVIMTSVNEPLVIEKRVGLGYLILHTDSMFINNHIPYEDNYVYFLNLFALPCDQEEPEEVILDVPSQKQGVYPFNDNLPVTWEGSFYDHGDRQVLWCGQTIGQCGCAMTGASMILNYYGFDKLVTLDMDPFVLNHRLNVNTTSNGNYYNSYGYTYGNLIWNSITDLSKLIASTNNTKIPLSKPYLEDYDLERVKELIREGVPVLLQVKRLGGVHWVTVVGFKGDDLYINDPVNFDRPPIDKPDLLSEHPTYHVQNRIVYYRQDILPYSKVLSVSYPNDQSTSLIDQSGDNLGETTGDEYVSDPTGINPPAPEGSGINTINLYDPENGVYLIKLLGAIGDPYTFFLRASNESGEVFGHTFTGILEEVPYLIEFEFNDEKDTLINKTIEVEVRPYDSSKIIKKNSQALIPVAVLANDVFDPLNIIFETAMLQNSHADEKHIDYPLKDYDKDGDLDRIFWFRADEMGIEEDQNEICFSATTLGGMAVQGCSTFVQ